MDTGIAAAVAAYTERVEEHTCTGGSDCEHPEAFYLIGFVNKDGIMEAYSGGHKSNPASAVEALIQVTDRLEIDRGEHPPIYAFAKSRDLFHSAADSVPPPPEVSMAMNQFTENLDSSDE